jgi:hypothetical protein
VSDETSIAIGDLEDLLGRLQGGHQALAEAVEKAAPEDFERESEEGESVKQILERTADDVNFYYGSLVAKAVSLPQPPFMKAAEYSSLHEAKMSLQVAHRRFYNLLHDLTSDDLERRTSLESTAEYTLRQVLETAAAHYRMRTGQIRDVQADQ